MGTPGTERKVTITYYGFASDAELAGQDEFKADESSLPVIIAEILMSKSLKDISIKVETTSDKALEDYAISAEDNKTIAGVLQNVLEIAYPELLVFRAVTGL
jgi:hypothetical protein